ncbi:hypothetical protein [Catenulispora rubra]|uniref:hypothetical protein n=1 Tax=Catenulispora rubra TaxID=280293 RepID=UPI001891F56B|nr:hypothetical protein [Catenulispora rubra]
MTATKTRRRTAFGTILVLMLALLGLAPSGASAASSCPPGGSHCYAIGQLYRNDFTGIYGHWHSNNMYLNDYNGSQHINSEMWLLIPGGGWVETGLTNANSSSDPNPCGCTAYEVFWDDAAANNGGYWQHWVANVTPDGTDHWYEIVHGNNNTWNIYHDGYLVGNSANAAAANGVRQDIGGEVASNILSNIHVDWFEMTAEFRDGAGNWYWSDGGASVPTQSIDNPPFTGYWVNSDWVWEHS